MFYETFISLFKICNRFFFVNISKDKHIIFTYLNTYYQWAYFMYIFCFD